MSFRDSRDDSFASPERARSFSLSLMCSYWRSRLLLHAFCGITPPLRVRLRRSVAPRAQFESRPNARNWHISSTIGRRSPRYARKWVVERGWPHPRVGLCSRSRPDSSGLERWVLDVVLRRVLVRQLVDDVETLGVRIIDLDERLPFRGQG